MRHAPECRECLLSRVVAEAKYAGADEATALRALDVCTRMYDSRAEEQIGASVLLCVDWFI